jgi:AcrR family transcriptional regulator
MDDFFDRILKPRKAAIVKAVLHLSDKFGINSITTKRIAAEVGFAESALYRHVKNKEDIFQWIMELTSGMLSENFNELQNETEDLNKLSKLFYIAIDFLEQFPGIYYFIFSDVYYSQNKKLFIHFEDLVWKLKDWVAATLDHGQKKDIFQTDFAAEDLAMNYLGVLHTSFTLWNVFKKRSESLNKIATPLFDQFLYLIKKR